MEGALYEVIAHPGKWVWNYFVELQRSWDLKPPGSSQTAQYPLLEEYTENHFEDPYIN